MHIKAHYLLAHIYINEGLTHTSTHTCTHTHKHTKDSRETKSSTFKKTYYYVWTPHHKTKCTPSLTNTPYSPWGSTTCYAQLWDGERFCHQRGVRAQGEHPSETVPGWMTPLHVEHQSVKRTHTHTHTHINDVYTDTHSNTHCAYTQPDTQTQTHKRVHACVRTKTYSAHSNSTSRSFKLESNCRGRVSLCLTSS